MRRWLSREAGKLGMNIMGVANVERWEQHNETPREFFPQSIWPWSRTVVVMGVQIFLPMIATTPSVVYSELYNTTNRLLDEAAYRLANALTVMSYRACFFPRDCYGDISALVKKPEAAFSHVLAGRYAGLGTIGFAHTLLTPQYGPRVRLVSVITDAPIAPNDVMAGSLCSGCGLCAKNCPAGALRKRRGGKTQAIGDMDKHLCASYHKRLKDELRYPCGVCAAVCPVGADREMYGASPISPEGAAHCRNFGV
ncbi:MAG: 4Fe-4S dicluster domain-containing protein [Synergistaceae bacterium]|jgi:O-acetylhomoserine (thiol)-lyase|nr:4Fe-4S dicluster domain-containing protein [Synergistaceae bacterium]